MGSNYWQGSVIMDPEFAEKMPIMAAIDLLWFF